MKLIVQPGEGTTPIIEAIKRAKKSIEIVIFRLDQSDIERALEDAAERGISVHALIAFTNRGGEKSLRKIEMRFLAKGITVARTADDLVRYHGKMMIVDRKELFILSYNFTHLDIERSRSFGIVTRNKQLVQEAGNLFDADTKRQTYKARSKKLIVSPANSRAQLTAFLQGAKRELMIYDVKISDRSILRTLDAQRKAGVRVRVIGRMASGGKLEWYPLTRLRLHTRAIIRDGKQAFLGSQSLRKLELDSRREIGVIVGTAKIVSALTTVFEDDWKAAEEAASKTRGPESARKSRRLAKAVAKNVPMKTVVKQVVNVIKKQTDLDLNHKKTKKAVEVAVAASLHKAVRKAAAKVVLQANVKK